jgi:hypothetical protein
MKRIERTRQEKNLLSKLSGEELVIDGTFTS